MSDFVTLDCNAPPAKLLLNIFCKVALLCDCCTLYTKNRSQAWKFAWTTSLAHVHKLERNIRFNLNAADSVFTRNSASSMNTYMLSNVNTIKQVRLSKLLRNVKYLSTVRCIGTYLHEQGEGLGNNLIYEVRDFWYYSFLVHKN